MRPSSRFQARRRDGILIVAASNAPAEVKAQAHYVCDGTADEVQIQAAIDEIAARPTTGGVDTSQRGGAIQLTTGYYNIASTIHLEPRIWLRGEGEDATHLQLVANVNMIDNTQFPTGNVTFTRLSDMTLNGNSGNGYAGWGIYVDTTLGTANQVLDLKLDHMWIRSFKKGGVWTDYAWGWVFDNCTIEYCGEIGATPTLLTATIFADNGDETVRVTANTHGFVEGDYVTLYSTDGGMKGYAGTWRIENVNDVNTFDIRCEFRAGFTPDGANDYYVSSGPGLALHRVTTGPKVNNCKIMANYGSNVVLQDTYYAKIVNSEFRASQAWTAAVELHNVQYMSFCQNLIYQPTSGGAPTNVFCLRWNVDANGYCKQNTVSENIISADNPASGEVILVAWPTDADATVQRIYYCNYNANVFRLGGARVTDVSVAGLVKRDNWVNNIGILSESGGNFALSAGAGNTTITIAHGLSANLVDCGYTVMATFSPSNVDMTDLNPRITGFDNTNITITCDAMDAADDVDFHIYCKLFGEWSDIASGTLS